MFFQQFFISKINQLILENFLKYISISNIYLLI